MLQVRQNLHIHNITKLLQTFWNNDVTIIIVSENKFHIQVISPPSLDFECPEAWHVRTFVFRLRGHNTDTD